MQLAAMVAFFFKLTFKAGMGSRADSEKNKTDTESGGAPPIGTQMLAAAASLLMAGLTITCSLSLNNLLNAWFNYALPEPSPLDLKKRVMYRLGIFVVVLMTVAVTIVLLANRTEAKQSLINLHHQHR